MVKFTTSDARTYLKWVCRKQCSHLDRFDCGASLFDGQRWYYIKKNEKSWELHITCPIEYSDTRDVVGVYKIPDDCLLSKDRFKVFFKECYQNERVDQDRNQTKTYLGARTKHPIYSYNGLPDHFDGEGCGKGLYGCNYCVYYQHMHLIHRLSDLSKQSIFIIKTTFYKLTRHRFYIDFTNLYERFNDFKLFPNFIDLCFERKDIGRSGKNHNRFFGFHEFDYVFFKCLNKFFFGLSFYDKKKIFARKDVREFHKKQSVRSIKLLKKIKNVHEI